MSGRRRRQGWEKEKERETGMGEKDRKRDKSGRERDRYVERRGGERDTGEKEISTCKNKEYKKAKSFLWMRESERERERETDT